MHNGRHPDIQHRILQVSGLHFVLEPCYPFMNHESIRPSLIFIPSHMRMQIETQVPGRTCMLAVLNLFESTAEL